jgi:uncharacterized membrane protein
MSSAGPQLRKPLRTRQVAGAAVFTAFVAAATSVFSVTIPATNGYFNVGEIMVYTSALLMGPYVGAFAGGVGSMISDLSLGYPYYAPGTLVIKGLEGFIVGYLSTRVFPAVSRTGWRGVSVAAGAVFSSALAYVGVVFLSGNLSPTLGDAWGIPAITVNLDVPFIFWFVVAAAAFAAIVYVGFRHQPKSGLSVLSVLLGGSEMVAGYYIYESFVLTLIAPASFTATLAPLTEVPFNIAQALIGLLVAVPLVRSIRRVTKGRENRMLGSAQAPGAGGK